MGKLTNFSLYMLAAAVLTGCGAGSGPEASAPPVADPEPPSINLADDSSSGGAAAVPQVPQAPEISPQSSDISSEGLVTKDSDGKALDKTAQLQQAVDYYTRVLEPKVPESEEEAKTFKGYPPLTDLQQLVQYKVIRAVPAAPSGKKYVIENGQVKLVAQ